jgi:hypothetical protein
MKVSAKLVLAGSVFSLGACTHVSRDTALELSQAGIQATTTLGTDVDARASRLRADRAAQDFVAAYNVMGKCPSVTHGTTADPNCDTAVFAASRAKNPVNVEIGKLADVIEKRSRALGALSAAYAALGDEANYDAPGELDKAIAPALDAVNDFGSAVGLGPLPAVAGEGAKLIGHALAANAQKRRLIRGSHEIAQVTRHMRLALTKERDLFGALDMLLANLDEETGRVMLKAGLLDPAPTARSIASGAGLPIKDSALNSALTSDAAFRGAAEVATLDTLGSRSSGDLDAGIALLAGLEVQHAKLEAGEPIDARRMAADIDKLAALISAAKK